MKEFLHGSLKNTFEGIFGKISEESMEEFFGVIVDKTRGEMHKRNPGELLGDFSQ